MSVAAPCSRRPSSNADGRIDETMTIERRARVIPTVSSRSPSGVDRSPKSLSTRPCLVRPKPSEKITRSRLSATDSSRVSTASGSAVSRETKSATSERPAKAASTAARMRSACFALAVTTMSDSEPRLTACSTTSVTTRCDLGVGALHGAGHRVGCARAALDVVDAEAAAAEVRARPRAARRARRRRTRR